MASGDWLQFLLIPKITRVHNSSDLDLFVLYLWVANITRPKATMITDEHMALKGHTQSLTISGFSHFLIVYSQIQCQSQFGQIQCTSHHKQRVETAFQLPEKETYLFLTFVMHCSFTLCKEKMWITLINIDEHYMCVWGVRFCQQCDQMSHKDEITYIGAGCRILKY